MSRSDYYNGEGYPDPTAYAAIKEENELEARVSSLVKALRTIVMLSGFDFVGRFELVDLRTGRHFK
jgi:hypothetical protein